jgi:hypothetical protein
MQPKNSTPPITETTKRIVSGTMSLADGAAKR